MPTRNKDRVYVALYARGGNEPNTYHWAIIVGPKKEGDGKLGYRYHVKHVLVPAALGQVKWEYQAIEIPLFQTAMLLGRIMVAKVTDGTQLHRSLAAVPIIQNNPEWTCRTWVKDAVASLEADGKSLGTRVTNWEEIEKTANEYIGTKRQQRRYDGSGPWKFRTVPTFDLIQKKETIP
ncbi:hypothetical protein LOZ36_004428 [Ophidiomyces ophidiicola]|nr:hypothetical protein LOZ36_004428 [Ophidiomyces ophidiicola]